VSGRYGGPPDGGLTVGMTEFAHRLDGARGEFVESGEPFGVDSVSPVVRALSAALEAVGEVPVPEAPDLGWSARRRSQPS
jgi:hypothetical protein